MRWCRMMAAGLLAGVACGGVAQEEAAETRKADLPVVQAVVVEDESEYFGEEEPGEVMPGCSWYCAAPPIIEYATSELQGKTGDEYGAKKAMDFDSRTAWVEGVDGPGIGERLEVILAMRKKDIVGPEFGIDELIVLNGYRKSDDTWKNNNRVKRLKVIVDDVEHALVDLADTKTVQRVKIPFFRLESGQTRTVEFEIVEVYKGAKHDDTAITEILFEGPGHH